MARKRSHGRPRLLVREASCPVSRSKGAWEKGAADGSVADTLATGLLMSSSQAALARTGAAIDHPIAVAHLGLPSSCTQRLTSVRGPDGDRPWSKGPRAGREWPSRRTAAACTGSFMSSLLEACPRSTPPGTNSTDKPGARSADGHRHGVHPRHTAEQCLPAAFSLQAQGQGCDSRNHHCRVTGAGPPRCTAIGLDFKYNLDGCRNLPIP